MQFVALVFLGRFEKAVSVVGVWSGGELSQRRVVVVSCGGGYGWVRQLRLPRYWRDRES
jgi:alkylation response protein AidB-like acyl-CoA dehydrogenase